MQGSLPDFSDLPSAARACETWLREAALPLWATVGCAPTGLFQEAITLQGSAAPPPHRARVQARQAYVYAAAALAGLGDQWLAVARTGFDFYRAHYRRPDGLFARLADDRGQVLDPTAHLYEQAFSLLAMATLYEAGSPIDLKGEAEQLMRALEPSRAPGGGWRETGDHPFQANAHMHLLEALLVWEAQGVDPAWAARADEVVELALRAFVDPKQGVLREYFDEQWRAAAGDDGRFTEPGHQFEWAWLMERWGAARGDPRARKAAVSLFDAGVRGVDPRRGVAVNGIWDDGSPRDANARLWPQTEYLKAALILGRQDHAMTAARTIARYLDTPVPGAWRDVMKPDGTFVEEPAPASSFYHVMCALLELRRLSGGA